MRRDGIVGAALGVVLSPLLASAAAIAPKSDALLPRSADAALEVTPHYVAMQPVRASSGSAGEARQEQRRQLAGRDKEPVLPHNAWLSNFKDIYYVVNITVGDQTIPVSVDTGSSDTWFVRSKFTCLNFANDRVPQSRCGFTTGFDGEFSQGTIPNVQFSRLYSDGTFVAGSFGFDDVTVGGITVAHQQLALVNYTYWYGDNETAGLLGLAYPYMTGADGNVDAYDPVFTSMWKSDQVQPLFSIALSRELGDNNKSAVGAPASSSSGNSNNNGAVKDTSGGAVQESSYLAFGGIPPVPYDNATWTRTPILSMQEMPSWGIDENVQGLYVIRADAYVYGRPPANASTNASTTDADSTEGLVVDTTQFPILIDCGSSLTRLPTPLAQAVFNSFYPPAMFLPNDGAWYAPCNAKAPRFGVRIGKDHVFWMAPEDLLRPGANDVETGRLCRIGLMDSDQGPWVLGVTFLSNVVAVFDVGNTEMRFAKRIEY